MASESETMLPCPFCGGTSVGEDYHETFSVDSSYYTFGCDHCGAGFVGGNTKENRAAWNRRALSASEPKASIEAKDALVTDTMVETIGKALYIYWDDVKEETRAKYYRPKVRAALNKALL